MKRVDRRLTKKLTLNRETIRALARNELTKVAGGADSHDPCTNGGPLAQPSTDAPCG